MTAPSPLLMPDDPQFWVAMGLWMTGDAQVARMEKAMWLL